MKKSKHKPYPRIYVCHTLYHVYISVIKELNLPEAEKQKGKADIALSTMFMDFGDLPGRLEASGVFGQILPLDEKRDENFPELMKHKENRHNIVKHMLNRIVYTKKYGKLQDNYITIDFTKYQDIYVFCDSDPIGYYLSYHHIYYHAVEDGLDCLKHFDAAHVDNQGHFKLKAALAAHNIIFIQNGYGKYCLDMEINDASVLPYTFEKYKEVPRKPLEQALTSAQKELLLQIFLPNAEKITKQLAGCEDCVLFLTEAFPGDANVRKAVADEILRDYCGDARVVIKPHPRDDLDYATLYPRCTVIQGNFPIEVLNFIDGIHFKKSISIITSALDTIDFVDEKVNIGPQIWDAYEPEEVHAFMKEAWNKHRPATEKEN